MLEGVELVLHKHGRHLASYGRTGKVQLLEECLCLLLE